MDSNLDTRIRTPEGKDLHKMFDVDQDARDDARTAPPQDKTNPDTAPGRDEGEGPHKSDDDQAGGKSGLSRGRKILYGSAAAVAIAAVAAGGALYYAQYVAPFETTDDAFVDARSFSVAPKVAGYVVDAPVTDNQHVSTGDTLFDIDRRDYQIALEQAEAQVQSAEASIKNFDAQIEAQKAQVQGAQSVVEQAQAALKFAQQDADRYSDLAKKGYGTVQNQQSTSSTLQQRQASLDQAKASLAAATSQIKTLDAQRNSAVADLARARAQRDQAQLNLDYTHVAAAQSGRLVRLTGAKGEYVQTGQSLAMFVPDQIWVTANFKETQVTDMRPGQKVDIELDAYPDHKVTGHIDSVQPGSGTAFSLLPAENATGNYVKVTQRIPVKIVVDDWPKDVAIGPGMSIVPTVRVR